MMNGKMKDLIIGVSTLIELGCIAGLAGIGLKRNRDCYNAECKLIEAEYNLGLSKIDHISKDIEIKKLKAEIEELKGEDKEES